MRRNPSRVSYSELSTAHSLENHVSLDITFKALQIIATTHLPAGISAEIPTTATFTYTRTHASGRAATMDSAVFWHCITFSHLLRLVKLLPITHSSRPCPVSPFILPCLTVCVRLSLPQYPASLRGQGCLFILSWEGPSPCDGKGSMFLPNGHNGKVRVWRENRAKGGLEPSAKPWQLESGKTT